MNTPGRIIRGKRGGGKLPEEEKISPKRGFKRKKLNLELESIYRWLTEKVPKVMGVHHRRAKQEGGAHHESECLHLIKTTKGNGGEEGSVLGGLQQGKIKSTQPAKWLSLSKDEELYDNEPES